MSINTTPVGNLSTFGSLVAKTNQLLGLANSNTVTTDSSMSGAMTSGNGYVNGYLTILNLSVANTLVGGNNTNQSNLNITSNVIASNGVVGNYLALTSNATNSNLNVTVNTGNFSFVNGLALNGLVSMNATSSMLIGNSTVNNNINSSSIALPTSISIGNSSVNTQINSSSLSVVNALSVGNSTVNTQINSTSVNTTNFTGAFLNLSGNANISGNLIIGGQIITTNTIAAQLTLGNSTVNTFINALAIMTGQTGYLSIGNTTVNTVANSTNLVFSNTSVASYFNINTIALNADGYLTIGNATVNVSINSSSISGAVNSTAINLGNSTVNTFINSSSIVIGNTALISIGNSLVNTIINAISYISGNSTSYISGNTTTDLWVNPISNASINATALNIGNSTTNTYANSSAVVIGNSSVNTGINATSIALGNSGAIGIISIGNSTVNTTINSTTYFSGNSSTFSTSNNTVDLWVTPTVNSTMTSSGLTLNTAASGLSLNSTALSVGNSTVFTALYGNGYLNSGNVTYNGNLFNLSTNNGVCLYAYSNTGNTTVIVGSNTSTAIGGYSGTGGTGVVGSSGVNPTFVGLNYNAGVAGVSNSNGYAIYGETFGNSVGLELWCQGSGSHPITAYVQGIVSNPVLDIDNNGTTTLWSTSPTTLIVGGNAVVNNNLNFRSYVVNVISSSLAVTNTMLGQIISLPSSSSITLTIGSTLALGGHFYVWCGATTNCLFANGPGVTLVRSGVLGGSANIIGSTSGGAFAEVINSGFNGAWFVKW